jgi:hypothetical protein
MVLVLLAAAGLLWLSGPRVMAGLERAEHERTLVSLGSGHGIDETRLISAARDYEASLVHHSDGRTLSSLAAMRMRMAKHEGYRTPKGAKFLDLTRKADRAALLHSPSLTRSWSRLMLVTMIEDLNDPRLPELLTLAVGTAPDNSRLEPVRMFGAMIIWDRLNPKQRHVVSEQIIYGARMSMFDLAVMASRFNRVEAVRKALAVEPTLLIRFDAEIMRQITR